MFDFASLPVPVVAAPMAGGPSTPKLVTAVAAAGGFGFLAAGYRSPDALAAEVARTRALGPAPFGVNVFVPEEPARVDLDDFTARVAAYAAERGLDVTVGTPDWADDDAYAAKLDALVNDPVAVVSFTFGLPSEGDVERLHRVGSAVACTVTTRAEALAARMVGADALVVQGPGAGGHRGTHRMADVPDTAPLPDLLTDLAGVGLPMLAAGGLGTAADLRAALDRGAVAAQLGTMFLLTPEAGTTPTHRAALGRRRDTVVTRAFSGRPARGLHNGFIDALDAYAPAAYPQVNQVTGPIRKAAAAAGDAQALHLWAGTAYRRAVAAPAGEIVRLLAAEL